MAVIALKKFSGEIPNLPKYALPNENAQQAINCDFAQKDLRPLKNGLLFKTTSATVKGIYTEDGVNFFTWNTETYAFKSPVVNDSFLRVYFNNSSGLKVTTRDQATTNGGVPTSSWDVGVPVPSVAPTLAVTERTTLRDPYGSATLSATAWYELNGVRYNEATVTLTATTAWRRYTFTPPTKTAYDPALQTGTPPSAVLMCNVRLTTASGTVVFSLTVSSESTAGARTSAFPGGLELNLTNDGVINLSWGVVETRAYVYTTVNTWDEESGPSLASTIDVTYMQDVTLTLTQPSFTGYRPFSKFNVYRTFGSNGSYLLVGSPTTTSSTDTSYAAASAGVSLPTLGFTPPPTGLFGLTALPNGVFAAFKDNLLYFSHPYRPHTWQYSMTFPLNIRGVCNAPQSLVVTTASNAYIVLGVDPASMQQQLLPVPQSGVTHRSMVQLEGAVAFASNDGIVLVTGSQASLNTSQQFFSREDWRDRYSDVLGDVRFVYHDGFLVAVSSSAAKGFIVRLDEATGAYSQFNETYDAAFYLPVLDTLYYSKGALLYRFRAATTYYTLDWWSKEFIFPDYVTFGAVYIRCTGPVTVTIYADRQQWRQFTASASGYYRLPAGKREVSWSVRFSTAAVVEEFVMAQTMKELGSA